MSLTGFLEVEIFRYLCTRKMRITKIEKSAVDKLDFNNLVFGKEFTDYMMYSDFDGKEWSEFVIEPLKNLSMHPATSVLHYGQAIFEGLKAYKNGKNEVNIFILMRRPRE